MSSRLLPFVSGIKKVKMNPMTIQAEKIIIIISKFSFPKAKKYTWEIIAPSFPDAADIPWHVDLYFVGNTSPGIINVVAFGPKLLNRFAQINNPNKIPVWFFKKAIAKKIIESNPKPIFWIGILPILSTNNTVNQYPGTVPKAEVIKLP